MKGKSIKLTLKYQKELRKYLEKGPRSSLCEAQALGRQAISLGLETLDLARIHEKALTTLVSVSDSPRTQNAVVRRAGTFFAESITPIEETHRRAQQDGSRLGRMIQTLRERTADLASSNRKLKLEISLRKSVEESLRKSEAHYSQLLEQSRHMQEQLRLLSRQLLSAQEDERKKISRELHDVIAQSLTNINLRLAALKKEAVLNSKDLEQKITSTQQLVEQSVSIVHRFARELRPTALDDLGLIPALHTYLKSFREQTGIRASLSAFAAVEEESPERRTVLYRVAQEALTNVGRHARADYVEVKIQKLDGAVCMTIKDNGKGFQEERVLHAKKGKRLGLLGMRERLEMVGGQLAITSAPGKGTTVVAKLPFGNGRARSPINSRGIRVR